MDPNLYNATMEGKLDVIRQNNDQLDTQLTPNHHTVLHVAAQFGQLQCAVEILELCPSLLRRVNIKGETPLHIAAREGYLDIVRELIECAKKLEQELESGRGGAAKEMLRATNKDKDTALHMAVRNCHDLEVLRLLIREYPDFRYLANNAEETPLYLAAEQGHKGIDVVAELLETCTSPPAYSGPGGRTALHAAVLKNMTGQSINRLLDWKPDLIKEADSYGWTPLHYAACNGNATGAALLLRTDKSVTYTSTAHEYDGNTALHLAAAHGHVEVMEELLSYCPDCWEMVNAKGRNVLHIAVDMEREKIIKFIVGKSWASQLINQKDDEGNTPLHLLAASSDCDVLELWYHRRADRSYAFNKRNIAPIDVKNKAEGILWNPETGFGRNMVGDDQENLANWKIFERNKKEKRKLAAETKNREEEIIKEGEKRNVERGRKTAETHMVVATLIATITFAAAFTIPGGYNSNQGDPELGMAVLAKAAAFKAFLVTNTITVVCSVSSLFLYIFASLYDDIEWEKLAHRYLAALLLILVAMVAMMLAFIAATFAVLAHSVALAVATCLVACIPLLIFFHELVKLVRKP